MEAAVIATRNEEVEAVVIATRNETIETAIIATRNEAVKTAVIATRNKTVEAAVIATSNEAVEAAVIATKNGELLSVQNETLHTQDDIQTMAVLEHQTIKHQTVVKNLFEQPSLEMHQGNSLNTLILRAGKDDASTSRTFSSLMPMPTTVKPQFMHRK